jgi:hypothetical protein
MAQYIENSEEEEAWRIASVRVIRHAQDLQQLAAAITRATVLRTLEPSLRRQTLLLRPYALPVGATCRVSYRVSFSSKLRQQLKTQIVKSLSPQFTRELFAITARYSAPGRSQLFLYDLVMQGDIVAGEQGTCSVGGLRVQLPESLTRVDRRWLMPLSNAGVTPSLASAFPDREYATSLLAGRQRQQARAAAESDDDDLEDGESMY